MSLRKPTTASLFTRRATSWLMPTLLLTSMSGWTGQHALLVGVSDYADPRIPDLEGPAYDVAAMQDVLINKWQFEATDVTVLMDAQATEVAILDAIDALAHESSPGDDIVIYYSGHGTSASDPDLGARLNLPDGSGAIVGSDFNPDKLNRQSLSDSRQDGLIIGRFDIRPRLEVLDNDRNVLVIFDACFAGNAARDIQSGYRPKTKRQIDLSQWMNLASIGEDQSSATGIKKPSRTRSLTNDTDSSFTYQNTVYFGAAAENQYAVDFSAADIESGTVTTIDGNPHGGFTDSLLRALWSAPDASGTLTFNSLFNRTVNQFNIWCKSCGHTPVSLPAASEMNNELMVRTILSVSDLLATDFGYDASSEPDFSNTLIVDTEYSNDADIALKSLLPENSLDLGSLERSIIPDLYFEDMGEHISAYAPDGQLISKLPLQTDQEAMSQWLRGRQWLKNRLSLDRRNERGAVQVSFRHPMASNVVSEGDYVHFSIRSDIPASLIVFVLDADSQLSLLYPLTEQERQFVLPALTTHRLPGENEQPIQVTPPWGTDTVLFYTLPPLHSLNPILKKLATMKSIAFENPSLATFVDTLNQESFVYSATTIRIVSTPAL